MFHKVASIDHVWLIKLNQQQNKFCFVVDFGYFVIKHMFERM